jgi:hypothetical protein
MSTSPVTWLSDAKWTSLTLKERGLIVASVECDVFKVHEVTQNDSPRIREYLNTAGAKPGSPWCASFVFWCFVRAGWRLSDGPGHPQSAFGWKAWAAKLGILLNTCKGAQRGDLAGWVNADGTGHIFFIVKAYSILGIWFMQTIEGNSNDAGSREGDRVIRKTRRWTSKMFRINMGAVRG